MKRQCIIQTTLSLCFVFLSTNWGLSQTFPTEPTIRLGKGIIQDVTYSPDGKLLAVASSIGVWLYNADDLTEVGMLQAPVSSLAWGMAFSPDGKTLAVVSTEVVLWDVPTQKPIGRLSEASGPLAFSPDGKTLATGDAHETIHLWDVQRLEEVATLEGHTRSVNSIAFSPDGKLLASGGWDNTARLWDLETEQEIWQTSEPDWLFLVAFSPDGKLLATVGNFDRAVRLWDVDRQKLVSEIKAQNSRVKIAFSPDGGLLALESGGDGILLWDVKAQVQVAVLKPAEEGAYLRGLAFHPDGVRLASWGQDNIVRVWNVETQQQVGRIDGYTDSMDTVFLSPDGKTVVTDGPIWDVTTQKRVPQQESFSARDLSADGKWIVSLGHGGFFIWNLEEQKTVALLKGGSGGIVRAAVFSPDAKLVATGGDDRRIRLWDVEREEEIAVFEGHTGSVETLAFTPDGKQLISGGRWPDTTVQIWDVQQQKHIATLQAHHAGIMDVAVSPDGELFASSDWDNKIKLWDLQQRQQIAEFNSGGPTLEFSPDGKWLAAATWGPTVRIWDVHAQTLTAELEGHAGNVMSVSFSSDGKWLASAGRDGAVLLWEMNPPAPTPVEPKGKRIISLGAIKRNALLQNYPNPFNPETWIPYQLAEAAHMRINIYDSSGRIVRNLDLGQKPAGSYIAQQRAAYWDGRNEQGESVSSGVYFYTLEAGAERVTRRMSVIR